MAAPASYPLYSRSFHSDETVKNERSQLLTPAGDPHTHGSSDDEPQKRRGGEGLFLGSSFNLASAAIGLGILSLPYTVNNSGIVLGGFLFVLMGLVTVYSLDILIKSAELCGKITYQQTVKETFGETISLVIGGVIIWSASGSTISSFTIVADLMSPVFPDGSVMSNRIFLMFLALLVLYPLCYLRKINSLRHASGTAIFAFFYMAGLVIVLFFVKGKTKNEIEYVGDQAVDIARSIPIIVYAYTCHTQAIPVYAELKNSTSKAMFYVICGGVFMSFFLYFSTGVFGYLTFGTEIKDNILLNYDHERIEVLIGRIMICSAIILGYPMSTWVMRDSFEQIYFYVKEKRSLSRKYDLEDSAPMKRDVSWIQNTIETSVMLSVSVGIAILVPKINVVFGLVGSTSSVTLNFILPDIKLAKRYPPKDPFSKLARIRYLGAHVLIGFGLLIGIVGTITTIINLV